MLGRLFRTSSKTSSSSFEESDDLPPLFRLADSFGVDRNLAACTLCELFCTFFLLYGGTSIAAGKISVGSDFDYAVGLGWGLVLIFTLYLGFNISGAHLNPAVSFLNLVLGKLSWKRFICYSIAQFVGSFLGAALTYIVYYDGITVFDGGIRQVYGPKATAQLFATYPKEYLSMAGGIIDQTITTAVLCLIVLSITDKRNRIPRQAQPALLGLSLWIIVATWSQNCGAALNPARDFGPRLFTFLVGYGWEVFSFRNYQWFWIPMTAPMVGAVLGAIVYKSFIGDYLPYMPVEADLVCTCHSRQSSAQVTSSNSCSVPTTPAVNAIPSPIFSLNMPGKTKKVVPNFAV